MNRAWGLAAGLLAGLGLVCGCLPQQTNTRAQVADDAADADRLATVGQKTVVGNADPIPVHGVGLVHGLAGTGSIPQADGWRAQLEQAIRREKGDPKKLLDDPNKTTSLVLVSTLIPAGAKAGDRLDVQVSLPPGSRTTSLKHGVLWPCDLTNAELAANARQAMQSAGVPVGKMPAADAGTVLSGHRLAVAEGHLIAGYDGPAPSADGAANGDKPDGPRAAVVWGGAKCQLDRPYYFILNENTPQPRLALVIAERLNAVFQAPGVVGNKVADAKVQGKPLVVAAVPPAYRLNHGRFLLVARQVPLNPVTPDSPYRKQLENELLQPETALVAALKLEALGTDSRQPLRVGLQSDSPWVKFAAAEALAYLGHADGAAELAALAENHPALRTHCLTALASLDDAVCLDQLAELMKKPDPQLRYGAFVALRSADERHEAIRGKRVNDSFWTHHVAADSAHPAVHVASSRRSEVVFFGSGWPVTGPVSFPLGKEFTVALKAGDPVATVTRVTIKNGEPTPVAVKCKADASAILTALGQLGGSYAEAVECVGRLQKADALAAAVEFDAAPRGITVQHLAQIARSDPSMERADLEVQRAGQPDVVQTSYDVPTDADAVKAAPPASEDVPALNRDPGRLFGPRSRP